MKVKIASSYVRQFFCCALSYLLLASSLMLPQARAASPSAPRATEANRAAAAAPTLSADAPRREGELVVRFRQGVSAERKSQVFAAKSARGKGGLKGESGAERVELEPGQDAAAVAAELRRDPSVELAEPNFLVARDQAAPDDPRFAEQWALRNTGQSGGAPGSDVNASAAWRETTGAASTVIAVLDSGIDFSHPDLKNNRWTNRGETAGNGLDDEHDGYADDTYGWNWVYGTGDAGDENGHGTSVAGVIAAEGGNRKGIAGVMWRASLMNLKVLDSSGTGDTASAVEAIDYAVAHGASVINCSWGTEADSALLREAVERAGKRGVVVVASAGNSGRDLDAQAYYPASFDLPNVIAVASSDGFDGLAGFSNWGAKRVAVAAPGTDILTTQLGGDYRYVSGTSASAPAVAGIAGLVKTLAPNATAAAVRSAVVNGARRVEALTGKVSSGGVADAAGALAALRGNPYNGNGQNGEGKGNDGANGNGNGQGQANKPYTPAALRRDNEQGRANGKKGLVVEPPSPEKGAPGANLPDLGESRRRRASADTAATAPSAPIHADLMCADCDPWGGGGGGAVEPNDPYFGTARTRPANDTGDPGVDLGSRNFNWSLPLVNLPGRAGLDLSLALYYNSLVWVKQGSSMQYNADHGTPAPGFELGLPRLQSRYYDYDSGAYSYIMVTPSGGRTEMRQTGTAGVYESTDSTYTQLTEGSAPVVRTTDGTQYVFGTQVGAEWRCTQIKDRNGNFISAAYDTANGHITTVTDTLGRVVNFNYNGDGTLGSISQTWGGTTHYYVWFVYTTVSVAPNFPGLGVYGVPSGGSQTVLSYFALANNESYHFDYNSYGQAYQVRHKAPDGHELGHTRYNMSDADLGGAALSDCPRFSARYEYAQDWNNNQEAVTTYSAATGVTFVNGVSMTGTLSQETAPDGTVYKEYAQNSGWADGLPQLSEVWSGGVKKKWTTYAWTQDNTSASYAANPRVYETNVYDAEGNRKRVTVEYNQGYGLPTVVREWGGSDGQTLLRTETTDYQLDPAYVGRRVIGLPWQKQVYNGAGGLLSKVQYYFDWDGGGDMFADTPAAATQHDRTNYGPSFLTGRGNLSDVIRYDVNDPNNAGGTIQETKYRVYTTGSVVMVRDHSWHTTYFGFGDNFSDGVNRNTFAYQTSVTDGDGYTSTAQYSYDFGAVTRTHAPTSGTGAGVTYADVVVQYDQYARVQSETNQTSQTYKRWAYETNDNYVHTYETLTGTTQAEEFHTWQVFDGAGRVRATAQDHPGSSAGYSGEYHTFDQMGRVVTASNTAEMNGSWVPSGDDAAGWRYTSQTYDWKGRPLQTTNSDGTTKVVTYGGCGCAGGEVSTRQDEHGRQRRLTQDTLGRLAKVEELNWSGTVYSTTQYAYNALDKLTQISQQGQTRTFDYDGHGRLWHKTTPEQGTTTYAYNADDTVASVTDARGAKTAYGYNYRHLPTSITYDLSGVAAGQNVAATPNVSLSYDAAGHRTSMTDGQGSVTYHYNSLALMDWEERAFNGVGSYRLSYGYNAGGELQSITYPSQFGSVSVSYGYDKAGRMTAVGGSGYAGVGSYANSVTYRAFGAVKGMNFADGRSLSTAYDARMRPTKWDVSGTLGYNYNYDYMNERTGRVSYAQSIYDSSLDRSYEYDHVGRLVYAHTGAEARAHAYSGQWGTMDGPYSQGFEYDAWGNMTHRFGWGGEVQGGGAGQSSDIFYAYTNNRRNGFSYDNAGNLTFDGGQHFTYDAAGRQTYVDWTNLQQGYDGDGLRVSKADTSTSTVYYLRSSVLGGATIAEIKNYGAGWVWNRGYVYSGQQLLAVQQDGSVNIVHEDPVTKSKRVVRTDGALMSAVEMDPYGADTSRSGNSAFQPKKFTSYERDQNGTDEAMFRRYNRWHSRFDQPDSFSGSNDLSDPQSLNRYAYTQGDPVNFTDPTGLDGDPICDADGKCYPWEPPVATVVATLVSLFDDWVLPAWASSPLPIYAMPLMPTGGGEPGGGIQRVHPSMGPRPTPPPQKPPANPQQKGFDECADKAWSNYRADYVLSTGEAALGGIGIGLTWVGLGKVGTFVGRAAPGTGRAIATASKGVKNGFQVAGGWLSGNMAWDAVHWGASIERELNSALADCAKQFPNANHSLTSLKSLFR